MTERDPVATQIWVSGRLGGVAVWPQMPSTTPVFVPAERIDQLIEELKEAKDAARDVQRREGP